MRYIYNLLFYLLTPLILIRLLWRSRKAPGYRSRWAERFGFFAIPKNHQNGILIHSVSVGETVAAIPLIHALQKKYPKLPITVTTMTVTGSQQLKSSVEDSVFHVYMPYDLPCAIKRFLSKINPCITIIMETELWPNLLYYCNKRQIPTILANARLSKRSAKKYARIKKFTATLLKQFNYIAAQAEADAKRFEQLGMPTERIEITGNMKFDITPPASTKETGELLRQQLGANRPVWIAASTHEGEEELALKAFAKIKSKLPDCLLVLAPRHPERFTEVATLCKRKKYSVTLRSSKEPCSTATDIFICDSMGELLQFFAASDVAFIGGSLVKTGGHNLLEPASFALPIISGPHTFNFAEATRLLKEADALIIIKDEKELAANVIRFLENPNLHQKFGDLAQAVVKANRGAVEKHMKLIEKLLS